MATWRAIVKGAVADWLNGVEDPRKLSSDQLARLLKDRTEANGYAIHDKRRCVRPRGAEELGRDMTEEEQTSVGITTHAR